jgi:hypothetical protein
MSYPYNANKKNETMDARIPKKVYLEGTEINVPGEFIQTLDH